MPVKIRTMNGVYNSTMSEIYYLRIRWWKQFYNHFF